MTNLPLSIAPVRALVCGAAFVAASLHPIGAAEHRLENVLVISDGVSQAYAQAIATTVSAARTLAIDRFGFDLPEFITVKVSAGKGERTRLYTDGSDHIFLSVPSEDSLRQPSATGTYHLYGLCHEIGHMAMYRSLEKRSWLSSAGAEGWAHYAGSRLLDLLHAREGDKLWPDAYDYRADGMPRLESQLKVARPEPVTRAAGFWLQLSEIIADKAFAELFSRWNQAPGDRLDSLRNALLAGASPARSSALDQWWNAASPVLVETAARSGFAVRTPDSTAKLGPAQSLSKDDGISAGKSSMAGSAHAVLFESPAHEAYLTGVQVFCSRYGYPAPPAEIASIWLCDAQMKPIKDFPVPYARFPRGQDGWVSISLPPTLVPEKFAICIGFNPTATKGVYVHYDAAADGKSWVGLPGRSPSPFSKGDWMIRAVVRPAS